MPTEYFERRERALLGDRFDALYAAPQDTAARGVTVSALRAAPEQFAAQADFPVEPSPFCKAAFVVHQPDFKPGRLSVLSYFFQKSNLQYKKTNTPKCPIRNDCIPHKQYSLLPPLS